MTNSSNHITVSEALSRLEKGEDIEHFSIDFEGESIKALDAFKLGKVGVEVPEELIEYDDADIAYDPEFDDYNWVRTDEDPVASLKEELTVEIEVDKAVSYWVKNKGIKLNDLLGKLLQDFYAANQMIKEKK